MKKMNKINIKSQPLLTRKNGFPCVYYHVHAIPNVPDPFFFRGRANSCFALSTETPERLEFIILWWLMCVKLRLISF